MDEHKNGILTASWDIVSPSFFPNEAAYAAASRDVLQPWTAGQASTYRKRFTKNGKKVVSSPGTSLEVKDKTGDSEVCIIRNRHRATRQ